MKMYDWSEAERVRTCIRWLNDDLVAMKYGKFRGLYLSSEWKSPNGEGYPDVDGDVLCRSVKTLKKFIACRKNAAGSKVSENLKFAIFC